MTEMTDEELDTWILEAMTKCPKEFQKLQMEMMKPGLRTIFNNQKHTEE